MTEPRRTRRTDLGGRPGSGSVDGEARGSAGSPADDWERVRAGGFRPAGGDRPPPPPQAGTPDLSALLALLEAARSAVPRELEQQFTGLLREALLTLRALIDWYLERLDGTRAERRVEDIPID